MALEADKRNLLIFFGLLACILIGTQMWSYSRITTAGLRMTSTGTMLSSTLAHSLPCRTLMATCLVAQLERSKHPQMALMAMTVSQPPARKDHLALHSRQDNQSP